MRWDVRAIRASKIVMTGGLALWVFLVTLGNIVDYESNLAFVRHVLAMDTVFPDTPLRARAITDPALQTAAFNLIIAVEAVVCLAFLAATVAMAAAFNASDDVFRKAKAGAAVGVALGFALWFIGFIGIAGEWFVMWQSATWNGQATAYRIVFTLVVVGIYVLIDNDGG